MIGYPIVFRCCECTIEEQTMDHLEHHIWSRHLQKFPFKCAHCDYPALSAENLMEHFAECHALEPKIEFKRNLEDEKRLRKMITESIAIEFDEAAQNHQNPVLQPLMEQGAPQIMLLPASNSQYEEIVQHQHPEENFNVMDDEDHVNDILEDEDDEDYVHELGDPIFIGAHDDDPDYILEDEIEPGTSMLQHLKYMRTRRMDKLIDNVVVTAAQRDSPGSANNPGASTAFDNGEHRKNERFACDQCPRTFKYQSKLEEHQRVHLGVRPFPCPYCNRHFSQKGALKTHMRRHTGEKPFVCQWECGRQFASASARTHHEKTHSGERPYQCTVCGKTFTKNSHVVRHLKNIHNREIIQSRQNPMIGDDVDGSDPKMNTEPGATNHIMDIQPRGKEISVVHDIVEQIHHDQQKEFMQL